MNAQETWYCLFDEEPLPGAQNMAMDQYFLELIESGVLHVPVLRTYRWARPTLSLGYHQQWARAVNLDALKARGVDLVRRWTGGRAVLHDREITYALIAPMNSPFQKRLKHNYTLIGLALNRFSSFAQRPTSLAPQALEKLKASRFTPCFASISDSEIESSGKKLIGSSQKLGKNAFLQHGSIPLENQSALLQEVTGTTLDMNEYMVSFEELCRASGTSLPSRENLLQQLRSAFEIQFNVRFRDIRELGLPKMDQVQAIAASTYGDDAWTFRR